MTSLQSGLTALVLAASLGFAANGVLGGVFSDTPDRSVSNQVAIDSIRPIALTNQTNIRLLQSEMRERSAEQETLINQVRLMRLDLCIFIAEERGMVVSDACGSDRSREE